MLRINCETGFVSALGAATFILLATSGMAQAYSEKTLYSFCSAKRCSDGAEPLGEVAIDQSGNLYGTTLHGGADATQEYAGSGVVFEYQPSTGQYTVIHSFCSLVNCADGKNPQSVKLVIDTAGNLYGTTLAGGKNSNGTVFQLLNGKSGWQEKVLYSFCPHPKRGCSGAAAPQTGLTYAGAASGQPYDGSSPLYGTTPVGGTNRYGTVYAIAPEAGTKKWSETVLYSFCSQANCTDGELPEAPPFVDNAGNLYGTTNIGGQFDPLGGVVFELSPNGAGGYTEATLYSFCAQANCADGKEPAASVVMDGNGNLLGSAGGGGSNGDGAIFELSPNGAQWQYNVLASFTGKNGLGPIGNLVLDASGNLFGATYGGGQTKKGGTVFEFNGSIQTLYGFCSVQGCPDGTHPYSGVVEDAAGNIYGTTAMGAKHNSGTLYEVSPSR